MITHALIDLHCHSSASDGALSPEALVKRALELGLTHLALTDHDTMQGVAAAQAAAAGTALQLIPGIEASSTWLTYQIHIVGLGLDPDHPAVKAFCLKQRQSRDERALKIGHKLEIIGFKDALANTQAMAGPNAVITRGSYARYLAAIGAARTPDEAFNQYLKQGKRAYVGTKWAGIEEVIAMIKVAGGVAVLAHPRRYKMTNTKLRLLISQFKQAGGIALEVASAQQRPCDRDYLAQLCGRFDVKASQGSDFHELGPYMDLGRNLSLPEGLEPVWTCQELMPYHFQA